MCCVNENRVSAFVSSLVQPHITAYDGNNERM